jgi:Carboxypeptidase regulatory-like domain
VSSSGRGIIVLGIFLLFIARPSPAQTTANKSIIEGTVTESSGAPIPGAHVTVTSDATSLVREVITGDSGLFGFNALDPGNYSIRVESGGAGASVKAVTVSIGRVLLPSCSWGHA